MQEGAAEDLTIGSANFISASTLARRSMAFDLVNTV